MILIILGIIVTIIVMVVRRARARRWAGRVENQPHNVIREASGNISALTKQCYQIGNAYATNHIIAINHVNSPIWENTHDRLVSELKEGVPKCHDAVNRAQYGRGQKYRGEAVIDFVGLALALERQLQVCSGCKERQGHSSVFYCALANPRNTGRLDANGNIQLSQHLH